MRSESIEWTWVSKLNVSSAARSPFLFDMTSNFDLVCDRRGSARQGGAEDVARSPRLPQSRREPQSNLPLAYLACLPTRIVVDGVLVCG